MQSNSEGLRSIHVNLIENTGTVNRLRVFTRLFLHESLDIIVPIDSLNNMVFYLIEWAEANNRIDELCARLNDFKLYNIATRLDEDGFTSAENAVWAICHQLSGIGGNYNLIDSVISPAGDISFKNLRSAALAHKIRTETPALAERLIIQPDSLLRPRFRVRKYGWAARAMVMSASLEGELRVAARQANEAVRFAEEAIRLYKTIRNLTVGEPRPDTLEYELECLQETQEPDRCHWYLTHALAVLGRARGKLAPLVRMLKVEQRISPAYREMWPPEELTDDIAWAKERLRSTDKQP
jgi:hypothetical protein